MTLSRGARALLTACVGLGLAFLYVPLVVVVVNSFNVERTFGWPPKGLTLEWWGRAIDNEGARTALLTSLKAGAGATVIALVLGTLLAFAVQRYQWFGRETVSLLVVLPIALPGIVTGVALKGTVLDVLDPVFGISFGLFTIIAGHATFCLVVVFNNVVARLRRTGGSLEEASMDLGANGVQTFRHVTLPAIRSAVLAGGLLAFGLSFDEIVVTTFTAGPGTQTLPIWIFNNLARPNQAPVVNVVAAVVIVLAVLPVYLSQRLSGGDAAGGGRL